MTSNHPPVVSPQGRWCPQCGRWALKCAVAEHRRVWRYPTTPTPATQQPYQPQPQQEVDPYVPVVPMVVSVARPTYPGRALAIAGMVLGIVAWGIAIFTFGLGSGFSFVLSAVGLPLGWVALRQARQANAPQGVAIASTVMNGIGLLLAALLLIFVVFAAAAGSGQ